MKFNGIVVLLIIATLAGVVVYRYMGGNADSDNSAEAVASGHIRLTGPAQTSVAESAAKEPAQEVSPADAEKDTGTVVSSASDAFHVSVPSQAEAAGLFQKGVALLDSGKNLEARKVLSDAMISGGLKGQQYSRCVALLTKLADEMILSSRTYAGDPLARVYTIRGGDSLAVIVKREKLMVSHEAIMRINGIKNPRVIRAGQKIKLLQGPFNVIINKHSYTLELYLQNTFVRSFRVGLGQDNSTPLGAWKVRDRVRKAPWTPPMGGVIYPGQADYPLGREGLWIALQGLDVSNETFGGFGIHGTDEPDSIGKQASHGCVRLLDDDIALLFDLLYNGSRVEVRP